MNHDKQVADCIARVREFIGLQAGAWPRGGSLSATAADRDSSEIRFNELALVLFHLQCERDAALRRLCDARGVAPKAVTDWRQIPAMPAAAFKEFEVTILAPHERTVVFHSSGTTEDRPSRHFHSPESLALYEASLRPWFQTHVWDDAPQNSVGRTMEPTAGALSLVCLTPALAVAPRSSLVCMFDSVARAFPWSQSEFVGQVESNGVWSLKQRRLVSLLELSARAQVPVALLGTAFSFLQLLEDLSKAGLEFHLPPGSRVLETGGYKGRRQALPKLELHAWITRALGVPAASIVSEYGMCELGSQAYDRSVGWPGRESQIRAGIFRFPPWARAQVLSPETGREVAEGETGLVRVYDLANVASSVGVQTEDLGVRRGNGFELVGRAPRAEPRGCSLLSVGASES